jgi:hypothetical protein
VALDEEIPRLQGEIDFLKIQHLSKEQLVSEAEDLYTRWDDLSPEDKRASSRPSWNGSPLARTR